MDRAWRRLSGCRKRAGQQRALEPDNGSAIESCYGCAKTAAATKPAPIALTAADCVGPPRNSIRSQAQLTDRHDVLAEPDSGCCWIGFCLHFVRQPRQTGQQWQVAGRDRYRPSATEGRLPLGKTSVVSDSEPAQRFWRACRTSKTTEGPRKLLLCGPPGSGRSTLVLTWRLYRSNSYISRCRS